MEDKFVFYYSAMKGGKTTRIFQKIHDLEENGQSVIVIKPLIDTKGDNQIINRKNEKRVVDILLGKNDSLFSSKFIKQIWYFNHILVDEAQFLQPNQVEELWEINKRTKIPVTCFGLKTNFKGEIIAGASRLFALADEIIELDSNSLCSCGNFAKFNARKVDGVFVMEGDEIKIDGKNEKVEYIPLCGSCFFKEVYSRGRKNEF